MEVESGKGVSAEATAKIERRKTSKFLIQRAAAVSRAADADIDWIGPGLMPDADGSAVVWKDVGEVEVPAGTHRKTAVQEALKQFEIDHGELPAVFRVLDMDAAEPIPVKLETPTPPPARLVIG
jgi:hypothetical protein